jgi:2-methylcitrate dehydratase PrpD
VPEQVRIERKAGLRQFSNKMVQRPATKQMINRINFYVDPDAESAGLDKMTSLLKIHMKDGSVITGRADFAKGSPTNPKTFEEAATKFRDAPNLPNGPKQKPRRSLPS